jgi:mannose-6-phosphate isomerase-like protein (cupin superfamily)
MDNDASLEILEWDGDGFQPLVSHGEWLVAIMNWEQRFDIESIGKVERHNKTDEVFVLINGPSVLFVIDDISTQVVDMQPGKLYNVPAGTWHNVIGTRDTKWLIVENNNTSYDNTEFRQLVPTELEVIGAQLPSWLS